MINQSGLPGYGNRSRVLRAVGLMMLVIGAGFGLLAALESTAFTSLARTDALPTVIRLWFLYVRQHRQPNRRLLQHLCSIPGAWLWAFPAQALVPGTGAGGSALLAGAGRTAGSTHLFRAAGIQGNRLACRASGRSAACIGIPGAANPPAALLPRLKPALYAGGG
jgi:hypothetical protein